MTACGRTKKQATAAMETLALRLIADRLEQGEALPGPMIVTFTLGPTAMKVLAKKTGLTPRDL